MLITNPKIIKMQLDEVERQTREAIAEDKKQYYFPELPIVNEDVEKYKNICDNYRNKFYKYRVFFYKIMIHREIYNESFNNLLKSNLLDDKAKEVIKQELKKNYQEKLNDEDYREKWWSYVQQEDLIEILEKEEEKGEDSLLAFPYKY